MNAGQLTTIAHLTSVLNSARQSGVVVEVGAVGVMPYNLEKFIYEGDIEEVGLTIVFDGNKYETLTSDELLRYQGEDEEAEMSEEVEAVLYGPRCSDVLEGETVQVLDKGKVTTWRRLADGWGRA